MEINTLTYIAAIGFSVLSIIMYIVGIDIIVKRCKEKQKYNVLDILAIILFAICVIVWSIIPYAVWSKIV